MQVFAIGQRAERQLKRRLYVGLLIGLGMASKYPEAGGCDRTADHGQGCDIHLTMTADQKRGRCLVVDSNAAFVAERPDSAAPFAGNPAVVMPL